MDQMIRCGRLSEFVIEIIKIRNQEKEEETLWQFFLHKVFDKSFKEFKESMAITSDTNATELKTSIDDSFKMLKSYIPEGI